MTLQRTTLKPITSRPFTINMGPIHPSCYGVVRLILSMSGEQIVSTDTHMYRRTVTTQALTKSKHYIEPIHSDDYGLLSYSFIAGLVDGDGSCRNGATTGEIRIFAHPDDLPLLSQLFHQLGGELRRDGRKINRGIFISLNNTNCKHGAVGFRSLIKNLKYIRNK
jgi:hypothetical protein